MSLVQDLKFALRLLLKDRWFTAVAALALALGIGVNTAVFTLVNAVLIRGLPFDSPGSIVSLGSTDARGRQLNVSRLDFADWKEAARSFSGMSLLLGATVNVSDEGRAPGQYSGSYNSASLFQLIGQHPLIGRDFRPEDDRPGADPAVILGNAVWKDRYGGAASILGRTIKVNGLVATVIGVMPPDMQFPFNAEIWIPAAQLPPELSNSTRDSRAFMVIARLAPGVTLARSRAELLGIATRLAREYPDTNKDIRATAMLFSDRVNGPQIRLMFLSLMGAVGFVLLIACANVANLLLARSAQRSREMAVRISLGASRWRIVRQLLVESVLLAVLAGVLGLALSVLGIRWFDSVTQNVGKPYWITFTMDGIVFAFAAAVCLGTGLAFGLAPALHVSKTDVNDVIKEGGGRSGTGGMRAHRWTSALIVVELVLTLVLLAGAGFMTRSFLVLYRTSLGIDTSHLLTMRLALPLTKYPERDMRTALFQHLEERLRGVSALQASALTSNAPLQGGLSRELSVIGRPDASGVPPPTVTVLTVGASYFETLGLPVVRGRTLTDMDGTPGHESAVVNQRFVSMHFSAEDPIGRRIRLIDGSPRPFDPSAPALEATIVGVVPTVRQRNDQEVDADPVVYLPYRMDPQRFSVLLVRAPGDPASVAALVREKMRAIEPDLPLFGIQTMDQSLAQQRWPYRVFGSMFATFAGIALLLSAVGLYAVTAYSVAQRTQEIGVRMALGAQPGQVLWLVMRRSLVELAIGLPLGLAGALGVGALLQGLLVQTSPSDPATLGAIAALMIAVSAAACLWPARRATRLDPATALRYE